MGELTSGISDVLLNREDSMTFCSRFLGRFGKPSGRLVLANVGQEAIICHVSSCKLFEKRSSRSSIKGSICISQIPLANRSWPAAAIPFSFFLKNFSWGHSSFRAFDGSRPTTMSAS